MYIACPSWRRFDEHAARLLDSRLLEMVGIRIANKMVMIPMTTRISTSENARGAEHRRAGERSITRSIPMSPLLPVRAKPTELIARRLPSRNRDSKPQQDKGVN